jgi:hypothetical protein
VLPLSKGRTLQRVVGGGLELWSTGKVPRHDRISGGARIKRGAQEGSVAAFPWFSGQVWARGSKGKERGKVGGTLGWFLGQVASPGAA